MADYGGSSMSLPQAVHTPSDNSSSDHSPLSVPTLIPTTNTTTPASASTSCKQRATDNDYQQQIIVSTPDNTNTAKKPRGRPPGSKNKPKASIVMTREIDTFPTMKPVILEISAGSDVVDNIINFARRSHLGLTVMSAFGTVSSVTLRHPTAPVPSLSLHGPFNIVSISGSCLGDTPNYNLFSPTPSSSTTPPAPAPYFGVTLAGSQGQVFGGIVAGKVTASGPVVVVASTVVNPMFHRLPLPNIEEPADHHLHQEENKPTVAVPAVGAAAGPSDHQVSAVMPTVYGGAASGVVTNPTPLNSWQMPPDVMHWAARPPY